MFCGSSPAWSPAVKVLHFHTSAGHESAILRGNIIGWRNLIFGTYQSIWGKRIIMTSNLHIFRVSIANRAC